MQPTSPNTGYLTLEKYKPMLVQKPLYKILHQPYL